MPKDKKQIPRVTTNTGNDLAITHTLLFYLVPILEKKGDVQRPLFIPVATKFKSVAKWDILRGNEDESVGLDSAFVVRVGSELNHS